MADPTSLAIIGKGNVGSSLGARLGAAGYPVTFGVRAGSDPGDLLQRVPGAQIATPEAAAAGADVIFLAVPGPVAVDAARALGDLSGKVLVDCNNPVRWDAGPVWNPPPEGSLTQALAAALPGTRVLKAFNTFGAEYHADPAIDAETAIDVFIAGDDVDAKTALTGIAQRAGFATVDAGPLRNAPVLENLAVLWIHLALAGGQGRDIAFKMLRRA